ncbi:hypothetical protein LCGC14_2139790 [marine sediment metagenome]|uniref:Uncharacterized protein n=1 Tax=marine sediment metagenome TaxID=412755 RepID=A0A0F9DYP1_9ZZZZ
MMRKHYIKTSKIGKIAKDLLDDKLCCENCGYYLESVTDKCKNCKNVYKLLLLKEVKGGKTKK